MFAAYVNFILSSFVLVPVHKLEGLSPMKTEGQQLYRIKS